MSNDNRNRLLSVVLLFIGAFAVAKANDKPNINLDQKIYLQVVVDNSTFKKLEPFVTKTLYRISRETLITVEWTKRDVCEVLPTLEDRKEKRIGHLILTNKRLEDCSNPTEPSTVNTPNNATTTPNNATTTPNNATTTPAKGVKRSAQEEKPRHERVKREENGNTKVLGPLWMVNKKWLCKVGHENKCDNLMDASSEDYVLGNLTSQINIYKVEIAPKGLQPRKEDEGFFDKERPIQVWLLILFCSAFFLLIIVCAFGLMKWRETNAKLKEAERKIKADASRRADGAQKADKNKDAKDEPPKGKVAEPKSTTPLIEKEKKKELEGDKEKPAPSERSIKEFTAKDGNTTTMPTLSRPNSLAQVIPMPSLHLNTASSQPISFPPKQSKDSHGSKMMSTVTATNLMTPTATNLSHPSESTEKSAKK